MKKLIFLLFLFLIGCTPAIKSGRIVDKLHREAYSKQVPVHVSDIEVGDTKIPVYVQQTVYFPEYFAVVIENENEKGKVVRRKVEVSQEIYNSHKLKDCIDFPD